MSLQVWLPLNGNLDNQGLTPVTVTNSSTTVDNAGKIGKCYKFSGSSQKISATLPSTVSSAVGSLACWVKFNTLPTNSGDVKWFALMQLGTAGGFASCRLGLYCEYGTGINISINGSSTGGNYKAYSFSTGVWYHICATYDGTNVKIYINGTKQLSKAATVGSYTTAASTLFMGGTNNYYLNGYMNDCRYYDHALSAQEVKKLAQGLILHYPLASPADFLVPEGYQQLEYIESAGAAWFNTGYTFNPETDSFKVIFKGNDTGNNGMIFASGGAKYTWLYYYSAGMRIYITNSSGSQQTVTGPSRDTNKHTAAYSNKHYYFDGADKGALTGSYVADTSPIHLFAYSNGSTNYPFKGRIYYVEIARNNVMQKIFVPAKRLSDNAIGMYEIYGKSLIPSMTSTAFTAGPNATISSPVYDITGYKNHGAVVGNLTAAAGSPRYKSSTVFDGNTAAIQTPNLTTMVTDKNYTISCWTYKTQIGSKNYQTIYGGPSGFELEARSSSSTDPLFRIYNWGGGTTAYEFGKWYHFCFVHTNSDSKLYINGILKITGSSQTVPSGNYFIGAWNTSSSQNYDGKMSDFRIYATALSAIEVAELYALGSA